MKILMICQYFPPENTIGAIRPARLSKYISKIDGVSVTVLATMPRNVQAQREERMYENVHVVRVEEGMFTRLMHRKRAMCTETTDAIQTEYTPNRLHQFVINLLFNIRQELEMHVHVKNGIRWLKKNNEQYNSIMSTYNTEFGHRVAIWYKKRNPMIRWVADFRDSTWQVYSSSKDIRKGKRFAALVAKSCDAITVVGEGILDTHKNDFGSTPCYVIPNGFDPDDRLESLSDGTCTNQNESVYQLVYTGSLYAGKRDITSLFRALQYLIEMKQVDPTKILVVYVGVDDVAFRKQSSGYPLVKTKIVGVLSHQAALQWQNTSAGLILASWCFTGDKGTLTGKYYEYLSANRPIICLISGNETGSILANLINEHNLGICYEAAADKVDYPRLCEYLLTQYRAIIEKKSDTYRPDMKYVMEYSYENLSRRVYNIIRA